MFDWAADLMTRNAHVGELGKAAVQSSRNIAQFGEKILYKPLKLSGRHRGNMEDTLDGMRLRSDEILVGTTRGVIKTRTLRRRVEEEQWDNEFARSIKGEPRHPVPGIGSDHVPASISDKTGVPLEEDQEDARLGHQDEGIDPPEAREVSIPPDRLGNQVRSDTLKRMYVTRGWGRKYGPTPGRPGCATIGMRAELEKIEEGREYLAREQTRVDARKQAQSSSPSHKRDVSGEWDRPPEKFWRMGEKDVTLRQDIAATSVLHPPLQAEDQPWTSKVDRPGNELPMFKQKTWKITSRWMQMKVQRPSHKRRGSLLMEDCSLAIGNTTSLKRTTSIWKTKLPEMNTLASTKV